MLKTQKPEIKWYAPQVLADQANDGFLCIVRSTGQTVHLVQSGAVDGLSKIGHALSPQTLADQIGDGLLSVVRFTGKTVRFVQSGTTGGASKVKQALSWGKKEEKSKQQPVDLTQEKPLSSTNSEAEEDNPPCGKEIKLEEGQDSLPEQEMTREKVPLKAIEKIFEKEDAPGKVAVSEPIREDTSLTKEELLQEEELPPDEELEQEIPQSPPLDMEVLLKQYSPRDRVEAIKLHKALDDLWHGSEAARRGALKTLVGLSQVAEPFLVASLQTNSPQVVEIALEGLSQIGSQRFIDCISDVLASSDPELRIVALRAAQWLTDDEAQPFLERGLRDPNAKVKRRVLSYLSWHDSSWALADIRRLCDDPEPDVKWAALEALLALRPSEAYDNLELMMPSLEPAYRHRALTLLEQRKSLLNKDSTTQTPYAPGNPPKEKEERPWKRF